MLVGGALPGVTYREHFELAAALDCFGAAKNHSSGDGQQPGDKQEYRVQGSLPKEPGPR